MKIWKNGGVTLTNGYPAELNKSVLFQVPFAEVSNVIINFFNLSIVQMMIYNKMDRNMLFEL